MPQADRPLFALLLRILAAIVGASLLALVKLAGESGVALPEIMFWRQAIPLPLMLTYLWATGGLRRLRTRRLGDHARRAGLGMTIMVLNFGGAILLPLAVSTSISFTAPLFAVLAAALVLREHIGPWRWTAVALGFAGILIITRPGDEAVPALGLAAALLASVMIAGINFQIRDLGRTEEPVVTAFYFAAFGAPMAALAMPFFMTAHNGAQWAMLLAIGVLGTLFQLLLTASLRYGAVASVIIMDYTALIWATAYGWLIWEHIPSRAIWLGAPLIVAAGLIIAWREQRLARAVPVSAAVDS